ncbi:MAG: RNA chaperone Hfq [Acidobacteriota bacterium]|nr:RNA chaperone Hfq [Acidobacteriota bacterium]MDW3228432.1 RNA chaperone Hfq [Acidobacteriota bacterium]MDY0231902.1 RNA chaperone Hfq [Candidatus Saccharicenans sp.]
MQRKLIRPNLSEVKEKMTKEAREKEAAKKRMTPPTDTHAENYYFLKQMNKKTRMVVALADGERVTGYIEWYDRNCFKLNREKAPNLLIYKRQVKYLYKLEQEEKSENPGASGSSGKAEKTPAAEARKSK